MLKGISYVFKEGQRKEVVVFCHGFLGDKWQKGMFEPIVEELERAGFGTLVFDFRGCGESEEASITVESMGKDLEEVLDFVEGKGKKAVLVGFSLGGLVAILLSKRAEALVLISPVTHALNIKERFSEREHYLKVEGGWIIRGGREYRVGEELADYLESIDQEKLLKDVNTRTLFIQSEKDEAIDAKRTEEAARLMGNRAEFLLIENAKHILSREESEAAAKAIVEFLKKVI